MNSKLWIRKTTSSCLMVAILATYSMVALANDGRAAGELTYSGSNVTVNGESAKSGRTVFSASTIATPENFSAVINLGKAGQIEIAPNTTLMLSFDANSAHADLSAGSLRVISSTNGVSVNANGTTSVIPAGGSASAGKANDDDYIDSSGKCVDANKNGKEECHSSYGWYWFALVMAGAGAGIIYAASRGSNYDFGGTGTVVSPTR